MSSSRIEQIIEEIEEYVEGCRYQPLSTTKIVVNKEELEELLRELRLKTPDEIKRYQKIISNKDAILSDAEAKAEGIIADAKAKAQDMVSQTEIMKQAYSQATDTINAANTQAQEILDSAQSDANAIRVSAISYTDEMLGSLSGMLGSALADVTEKYSGLIGTLQNCYDVVNQNRAELAPAMDADEEPAVIPAEEPVQEEEEAIDEIEELEDEDF
jgi:hypothetical protein